MDFDGGGSLRGLVRSVSGKLLRQPSSEDIRSLASPESKIIDEEPEVLECRVCRGESEPDRPLYVPCLCSGSIMYIHGECLEQWLEHSHKNSCELCSHKFSFTPIYAPGTPEILPWWQVGLSCIRISLTNWLPRALRVVMALLLWLLVVPLATSWLYRLWIHRSRVLLPALFMQRLTLICIWGDSVSGAIIAGAIILSFLSLMTFVDFIADQIVVREEWNANVVDPQVPAPPGPTNLLPPTPTDPPVPLLDETEGGQNLPPVPPQDAHSEEQNFITGQIGPSEVIPAAQLSPPVPHNSPSVSSSLDVYSDRHEAVENDGFLGPNIGEGITIVRMHEVLGEEHFAERRLEERNRQGAHASIYDSQANLREFQRNVQLQEEAERIAQENALAAERAAQNAAEAEARVMAAAAIPNEGAGPPIAFRELLGLAGPIALLPKYVLWLLAFNGAYLGLFAFIPYSVGASVTGALSKYLHGVQFSQFQPITEALGHTAVALSAAEDHTLQLADLATICLGYGVMSIMVFTWRAIICAVCHRVAYPTLHRARRAMRVLAAIVKVGLLLSLKMLLLPLLLGGCLDAAALPLFSATPQDRLQFLGENLVGSLLLHWVLGITFMLIVTVSVLQLREVLHPDILAGVIRPQEPHPDLLGSLLQERGKTHARRMAMSLAIYVALVMFFVWLPSRLAAVLCNGIFPFELQLRYVVSQLQIPTELIIFHLAMLACLERYKDSVGQMQHLWLVCWCRRLGLTRYLLPLPVLPSQAVIGDNDENDIQVGSPLVRPLPGWDDPDGVNQGRWAWAGETKGPIENSLAPRIRPKSLLGTIIRMLVILVLAWLFTLMHCVLSISIPFVLGRVMFRILRVPSRWAHDPFAFVVGFGMARLLALVLPKSISIKGSIRRFINFRISPHVALSILGFWIGWGIILPSLLSTLSRVAFLSAPENYFSVFNPLDWPIGMILAFAIQNIWAVSCHLGIFDKIINWTKGHGWNSNVSEKYWQSYVKSAIQAHRIIFFEMRLDRDHQSKSACKRLKSFLKPFLYSASIHYIGVVIGLVAWYYVPVNIAPDRRFNSVKAALWVLILHYAVEVLSLPMKKWLRILHDNVRDERYLCGLKLQNHPTASKRMHPRVTAESTLKAEFSTYRDFVQ